MSGGSTGRCLTALTDKSCHGSVCNIEQVLEYFRQQEVEKCCRGEIQLIFAAVYIDSSLGLLLLSSQLSPSSPSFFYFFYFSMKQTFYICDLEGGEKKNPLHLTSQMRRKEVVKAFWGKRVLELDVLMTERRGKKKKNYAAPPLSILTHLFFCRT